MILGYYYGDTGDREFSVSSTDMGLVLFNIPRGRVELVARDISIIRRYVRDDLNRELVWDVE